VTAIIGPSGMWESTLLRCVNRMNDLIEGVQDAGRYAGQWRFDLCAGRGCDPSCESGWGMVFQKPNPFPMSIFENVTNP